MLCGDDIVFYNGFQHLRYRWMIKGEAAVNRKDWVGGGRGCEGAGGAGKTESEGKDSENEDGSL